MAQASDDTPIQAQHADWVATRLAGNQDEQKGITAQIVELEAQLKRLQEDEAFLTKLQAQVPAVAPAASSEPAAGTTPASSSTVAEDAAEAAVPTPVPQQRKEKAAAKSAQGRPAKKTAATSTTKKKTTKADTQAGTKEAGAKAGTKTAARTPATKTAAKKAPAKAPAKVAAKAPAKTSAKTAAPKRSTGRKTGVLPLRDLIVDILAKRPGESFAVNEVCDTLNKTHPDRATSEKVVRVNLDTLAINKVIGKDRKDKTVRFSYLEPGTAEAKASSSAPQGKNEDVTASA
ncbi:hypothetical protein ACFQVC_34200 [Streptomyces monticola]|uniref:Uncharacterized protein n=1 Tax=Streptomyces monticola TaxID=2666263 RepID=A0ABW2JV58_9ACTN